MKTIALKVIRYSQNQICMLYNTKYPKMILPLLLLCLSSEDVLFLP